MKRCNMMDWLDAVRRRESISACNVFPKGRIMGV